MGTALGGFTGSQVRTATKSNSAKSTNRSGTIANTGFPTRNNNTEKNDNVDQMVYNTMGQLGETMLEYQRMINEENRSAAEWATYMSMAEAQRNRDFQTGIYNQTSAYNAAEAQKNRDWQEQMANTSYQRAVKDMKAAGINPILAYSNGGAVTPSGGTATVGTLTGSMGSAYTYQAQQADFASAINKMASSNNTAMTALSSLLGAVLKIAAFA